jgi:predicted ATPase/class 3 adenylate cyclase
VDSLGAESYRAFLITDVVGSTVLTQERPKEYGEALALHNELAERLFAEFGGRLLKSRGQGDSLLGEFNAPADALRAACAFRESLSSLPGQMISCRYAVQFGLCYGDGHDFFGHTLNLCARLRDIGHPGQIITSAAVAELARHLEKEGFQFRDLGWHGLKDIAQPVRLAEFDHVGTTKVFPRLKTRSRFRMPSFGTPFMGREKELGRIGDALDQHACAQLIGPGGIGKTRLSARAAEVYSDRIGCPAVFISLIEAVDAASVENVVATAFGHRSLDEVTRGFDGPFVMVLDNCEHVASHVSALVARLTDVNLGLKVIATTRERLALPSCRTIPLDGFDDLDTSVTLFMKLATAVDDTFEASPDDMMDIRALCELSQGIPLVIELAASYVHAYSVAQIKERAFELVRNRKGAGRHANIDAVLTASVSRLPDHVREPAGQLAWFAGGFTLAAAEAVVGTVASGVLQSLVDHCLLRFDRAAHPPRYRYLEVVRIFLRSHCPVPPGMLPWAVAYAEKLTADQGEEALESIAQEMPNFRVALSNLPPNDPERMGVALVTQMSIYWLSSGLQEGASWCKAVLSSHPEPASVLQCPLYANSYNRFGAVLYQLGLLTDAADAFHQAQQYAEKIGDRSLTMSIKLNLGLIMGAENRLDEAREMFTEAHDFFLAEGMKQRWVITMLNLGHLELSAGNLALAQQWLVKCRNAAQAEYPYTAQLCNLNLATWALLSEEDPDPYLDEVRTLETSLDLNNRALLYHMLAVASYQRGDRVREMSFRAQLSALIEDGATLSNLVRKLENKVTPSSLL